MATDDRLFLNVPLNTNDRNPCSPPDMGPVWRGVMIRAPRRVFLKRSTIGGRSVTLPDIPICGYMLLDVPTVPSNYRLRLVAIDVATGKTYSGNVVELDRSPTVPPPVKPKPLTPQEAAGLASGGCFNPNLTDFVDLPKLPAVYAVHVEFRGRKSNSVTIEVVKRE